MSQECFPLCELPARRRRVRFRRERACATFQARITRADMHANPMPGDAAAHIAEKVADNPRLARKEP